MSRRFARIALTIAASSLIVSGLLPLTDAVATTSPDIRPFSGLGSWVDLYDYQLNAWTVTGVMQSHGVKTVYLETGRWNTPDTSSSAAFADKSKVDWWIHAAHARGMKIVGWYLPAYDNMQRDVRRTAMIWTYRTGRGQHFDGVGIDIEYKSQMPSLSAWNTAVWTHAEKVRAALGRGAPVAAIVPAPLGMAVRPQDWAGFPWKQLVRYTNVFMPMGYWTYRSDCSSDASHCAYGYTKGNITETRRLTGNASLHVHIIGGIANHATADDINRFVQAAKDAAAFGGSLYDYNTTTSSEWAGLEPLRSLG